MVDKKRLTLTGKNIPDKIYNKLDKLANERTLTPYIVSLVEKEETMDKLLSILSIMLSKIDKLDEQMVEIKDKLDNGVVSVPAPEEKKEENKQDIESSSIQQGNIGVNTDEIKGEKFEAQDDYDF